MTRMHKWAAGTAAGWALTLALGWMLLVSPQRSEAAALQEERAATAASNASTELTVEAQEALLPGESAARAETEAVHERIPVGGSGTSDLLRSLNSLAKDTGLLLTAVTPAPVVPLNALAGVEDPAASPAPAAAGGELAQSTVTISGEGDYFAAQAFLAGLERLERAFLVTATSISTSAVVGSVPGDVTLQVTGRVFSLTDATVTTTTNDTTTTGTS